MFGAMPSDFMLFEVTEQPDVEEDEESVLTSDANTRKWDVNHRCAGETIDVDKRVFLFKSRFVLPIYLLRLDPGS